MNEVEAREDTMTYVVLRPSYGSSKIQSDPNFKEESITYKVPRSGAYYTRHDPVKSHVMYFTKKVKVASDSAQRQYVKERHLDIPMLTGRGIHGEGRTRKILEYFGQKAYDYEVVIGVWPEDSHNGFDGNTCQYDALFYALAHHGYDPLSPLREGSDFRTKMERSLAEVIYREVKAHKRTGEKAYTSDKIRSWARNARDLVRDYIRGGLTAVMKDPPTESTVDTRKARQKGNSTLYKYGLMNALWESGQLEMDIRILDVRAIARAVPTAATKESIRRAEGRIKKLRSEAERKSEASKKRTDVVSKSKAQKLKRLFEDVLLNYKRLREYGRIQNMTRGTRADQRLSAQMVQNSITAFADAGGLKATDPRIIQALRAAFDYAQTIIDAYR